MRRPKTKKASVSQLSIRKGDVVEVTLDDGTKKATVASSDPWQLGHGDWVVGLDGITGGYDLTRCKKLQIRPLTPS